MSFQFPFRRFFSLSGQAGRLIPCLVLFHSILLVFASSSPLAASPRSIGNKLDRIFILTAVDLDGNVLVVKSSDGSRKTIYSSISSSGFNTIRDLINQSVSGGKAPAFKLIPESLGYFLGSWENLRRLDQSISAVVVPDGAEVQNAINLLTAEGVQKKEAERLIGVDAVVFCPAPAVYAEEYRDTYHHRRTGAKFIPCSFSEATLRQVLKEPLERKQTELIPLPLWDFVRHLSTEKDEVINPIEVIAHPSVGDGIDSAVKNKSFIRDTLYPAKPAKEAQ